MAQLSDPGEKLDAWDNRLDNEILESFGYETVDLDWVLEVLHSRPGDTFLDVGCGNGELLAAAVERGLTSTGIEITPEAAVISLKSAPRAKVVVGSAQDIPFDSDFFQRVTCLGVMHFFSDPVGGMREIYRVLKPGGRACLLLPNSDFIGWKRKRELSAWDHTDSKTFFSCAVWKTMLKDAGFEIPTVYPGMPTKSHDTRRWVRFWRQVINFWTRCLPKMFISEFIFICQKPL